jgi:hypothetical protein
MDTYAVIRESLDSGAIPPPRTPQWELFFRREVAAIGMQLTHYRRCCICYGEISDEDTTVRTLDSGTSGGAFKGPRRHGRCPDVHELRRCPQCAAIEFPLPRGVSHHRTCTHTGTVQALA